MKKIILLLIIGLNSNIFFGQVVGGSGICEVNSDPNTISSLEDLGLSECKKLYYAGEHYIYDPTLAIGSRWVKEIQSIIKDAVSEGVLLNPELGDPTATSPNTLGVNAIDIQMDRGESTEAATGANSIAIGSRNKSVDFGSVSIGIDTDALKGSSVAIGRFATSNGTNSNVIGRNSTAYSFGETVLGAFAETYSASSSVSWNINDKVFVVGNGTSTSSRSNVFEIYKSGAVKFDQLTNNSIVPNPSEGMLIYSNDTDAFEWYDGTEWNAFGNTGNSDNIGTADLQLTSNRELDLDGKTFGIFSNKGINSVDKVFSATSNTLTLKAPKNGTLTEANLYLSDNTSILTSGSSADPSLIGYGDSDNTEISNEFMAISSDNSMSVSDAYLAVLQNKDIRIKTDQTLTGSGQILSRVDADNSVGWIDGSSITSNLATDNLTQDLETRTYNASGQDLVFSDINTFSNVGKGLYQFDTGVNTSNYFSGTGNKYLFESRLSLDDGSAYDVRRGGILGGVDMYGTTSVNNGNLAGLYGLIHNYGTGAANQSRGGLFIVENNSTGTMDNASGVFSEIGNEGTGAIDNAASFRAKVTGTGTINDYKAFHLGPESTINGAGFFLANDKSDFPSYLAGKLSVGSSITSLTHNLFVQGDGSTFDPVRFNGIRNASASYDQVLVINGSGIIRKRDDSAYTSSGLNIYNGDGSLDSDRSIDLDGFDLSFSDGSTNIFDYNDAINMTTMFTPPVNGDQVSFQMLPDFAQISSTSNIKFIVYNNPDETGVTGNFQVGNAGIQWNTGLGNERRGFFVDENGGLFARAEDFELSTTGNTLLKTDLLGKIEYTDYNLPQIDGVKNQVARTDGLGNVSWGVPSNLGQITISSGTWNATNPVFIQTLNTGGTNPLPVWGGSEGDVITYMNKSTAIWTVSGSIDNVPSTTLNILSGETVHFMWDATNTTFWTF